MSRQGKPTRPLKANDRRHGSYSTYQAYGCRCPACRAAMTEYFEARKEEGPLSHGAAGYQLGCRCDECKAWQKRTGARRRKALRDYKPTFPGVDDATKANLSDFE